VNDRSSVSIDGICFRSSPNRITHRSHTHTHTHTHAQKMIHNEYSILMRAVWLTSAPPPSTSGRPTSRLVLASRRSSAPRIARGQMNLDDVSCIINQHLPDLPEPQTALSHLAEAEDRCCDRICIDIELPDSKRNH
jgi:hypothetical protein